MKSLTLRASVALACALSLTACGGDDGNLLLGGYVTGLFRDGLVLQNKGGAPLTIAAGQTTFSFPDLIGNDEAFEVTIKSKPDSAKCDVINGKGTSGALNVTSVEIRCTTNSYDLGGSVSGLDVNGLVLVNGAERQEVKAGATSFVFNTPRPLPPDGVKFTTGQVFDGAPYGVTVLTQPAGRTCSVTNGVGVMGDKAVTAVQVKCV